MGQSYLNLLAKSAGLVANPSQDDKAGWDFELETPSPTVVEYHAHSKPLYRIQVKATVGSSASVSMTFSSLLSLIRFSGPAFLFFVRFLPDGSPEEAHLLHIDKAFAEDVLTKMRLKEVALKDVFRVNKQKLAVRFQQATLVTPMNGARLKQMLASVADPTYLDYVTSKVRWLRELEIRGGTILVDLTLEGENVKAMADGLLGYDKEFSADAVQYPAPMGIPDERPVKKGGIQVTKVRPNEKNKLACIVRLRTQEFGTSYAFAGTSYSSIGVVPAALAGARIATSMFDIVYRREPRGVEFSPVDLQDRELVVPVRELKNFLAYVDEASFEDVAATFIEVAPVNGKAPLKVRAESKVFISDEQLQMKGTLDLLYRRLDELGLGDARIRPSQYWDSPSMFSLLLHAGEKYSPALSFEFVAPGAAAAADTVDVVVFHSRIELEGNVVAFFVAFFGKVEALQDAKYIGSFARAESVGQRAIPTGSDVDAVVKSELQRIEQVLTDRGHRPLGA